MSSRWLTPGLVVVLLFISLWPALTGSTSPTPDDGFQQAFGQVRDHSNWWQGWSGDADGNGLDDRLDAALADPHAATPTVPVFLIYDHLPTDAEVAAVEQLVTVDHRSPYVELLTVYEAPLSLIPRLLSLPGVVQVQQQNQMVPFLDVSARAIKARPSNEYSGQDVWQTLGYDGSSVNVAVLDTGVDDEHETMQGKFVAGYDATAIAGDPNGGNGQTNPDDGDGHGTHVASTVLGNPDDQQYMGVAPGAGLVDVKVMTDAGVSNSGYTQDGIDWCIQHMDDFNIRVLSMSFGSATGNDDGSSAEAETVNRAVEHGLVAIIAAGNDGDQRIPSPGSADLAITIAAADDGNTVSRDDDVIAGYSNYGPRLDDGDDNLQDELKPEITAFGTNIMAAENSRFGPATNGYVEKSGTSMATPHISGVVALMLDAAPDLSPKQVERALLWAAEDAQETGREDHYNESLNSRYAQHWGWGLADAYRAVQAALGGIVEVSIESPRNDMTVQGVIDISGTASGHDLQRVELEIYGQVYTAEGTDSWTYRWDTRSVPNGSTRVKATAIAAGNLTDTALINVKVANPPGSGDSHDETTMERLEGFIDELRGSDRFPLVVGGVGLLLLIVIVGVVVVKRRDGKNGYEDW